MNRVPDTPHLPSMVEAEQVHLRFPTRPDWIEPAVEFLRQRAIFCGACDEARAGRIMMGLHEAISNAIVHGNLELSSQLKEQGDAVFAQELARRCADHRLANRSVVVLIEYNGAECRWSITDEGKGFDVDRVLQRDPTSGEEILLSSGRGLLLMRAFFDELHYHDGGRRLELVLRKECVRRQEIRHPFHRQVRVAPVREDGAADWTAAHDALTRNLSAGGMALLQAQLITAGRILIGLEVDGQLHHIPASVRHSRSIADGLVELGCEFEVAPSSISGAAADDAAQRISAFVELLQYNAYPHDERRLFPRAAYSGVIHLLGDDDEKPVIGFGRDLSKGGVAFVTATPVPTGSRLLALSVPSGSPIQVAASIIRCDCITTGFYDIGARFEFADSTPDEQWALTRKEHR
jgi:anti-sigma regulatory factor (Ser/Thr protein kinase)